VHGPHGQHSVEHLSGYGWLPHGRQGHELAPVFTREANAARRLGIPLHLLRIQHLRGTGPHGGQFQNVHQRPLVHSKHPPGSPGWIHDVKDALKADGVLGNIGGGLTGFSQDLRHVQDLKNAGEWANLLGSAGGVLNKLGTAGTVLGAGLNFFQDLNHKHYSVGHAVEDTGFKTGGGVAGMPIHHY
jgi:hypothetical protein